MKRSVLAIFALCIGCAVFAAPVLAQDNIEADTYDTKVPPGMELKQLGSKPSVRAVLPVGSTIRKQGDVRIIEGSGEYSARKFVAYDEKFNQLTQELDAARKDIEEMKKAIAELQKPKLASTEK